MRCITSHRVGECREDLFDDDAVVFMWWVFDPSMSSCFDGLMLRRAQHEMLNVITSAVEPEF